MRKSKPGIPRPDSVFLEIECKRCGKKSVVFSKSATEVECECGESLVSPTGGESRIKGRILRVLE